MGFAGSAFAAGNPPWEPVANPPEVGSLTFYNAAGQQITGGSTTAQPFAAYVQGIDRYPCGRHQGHCARLHAGRRPGPRGVER